MFDNDAKNASKPNPLLFRSHTMDDIDTLRKKEEERKLIFGESHVEDLITRNWEEQQRIRSGQMISSQGSSKWKEEKSGATDQENKGKSHKAQKLFANRRKQSQRIAETVTKKNPSITRAHRHRLALSQRLHNDDDDDDTPRKSNKARSKSSPRGFQFRKDRKVHNSQVSKRKGRSQSSPRSRSRSENTNQEDTKNLVVDAKKNQQWDPFSNAVYQDIKFSDPSPTSVPDAVFTDFMPEAGSSYVDFDCDTSFLPF